MNEITINKKYQIQESIIKTYFATLGRQIPLNEQQNFLNICMANGLNPFKREVYGVMRWDSNAGKEVLSPITGYEVYIRRAADDINYDGYETLFEDKDGVPISCTCKVYKKGISRPFTTKIFYKEFAGKKKDGTITQIWREKAYFMLEKCAIAIGHRRAVETLQGMPYIIEELLPETHEVPSVNVNIIELIKKDADLTKKLSQLKWTTKQIVDCYNDCNGDLNQMDIILTGEIDVLQWDNFKDRPDAQLDKKKGKFDGDIDVSEAVKSYFNKKNEENKAEDDDLPFR